MPQVSRRELLGGAALGGVSGLAGCMYLPWNSPIATADPGETTPVEGDPIQELSVDTFPDWLPFTGSVEVLQQPTPTQARGILRITFKNQSSNTWWVSAGTYGMPFPIAKSDGLVVAGDFSKENGCLVHHDEQYTEGRVDIHVFEGGEQLREKRSFGTHENAAENCLPSGEYRFTHPYDAEPKSQPEDEKDFRWGFTLVLE